MKTELFKIFVAIQFLVCGTNAMACIGAETKYQVSFSKDEGDALAVSLRNPEGKTIQYSDDIGYLGIHMALTYLVKADSEKSDIDLSANASITDFMKKRLDVFEKAIHAYLSDSEKKKVIAAIANFRKAISGNTVSKKEVLTAFGEISSSLFEQNVQVKVASRALGSTSWGEPVALSSLIPEEVPTYAKFRSGCSNSIAGLNVNVGADVAKEGAKDLELPSFTTN